MSNRQKISIQCETCNGTGISSQLKNCGFECVDCDGNGGRIIEVIPFRGKQRKAGINRVFASGYELPLEFHPSSEEGVIIWQEEAVKYQDWLRGKKPLPPKSVICPAIYIGGRALKECKSVLMQGKRMVECSEFGSKHLCWEKYQENFS